MSWIKVFALLPIMGVALVLNAETVNDYVYEKTPTNAQPQSKIVKKGKKDTQIKMGDKTIEVKAEDVKGKTEVSNKEEAATGVESNNNEVACVPIDKKEPMEIHITPDEPFDVVEEMPKFPGGDAAMMEFLRNTVKYPEEAMKNGIQGRVVVQFIVEKDGSISGAEVIKKVNEHLDAEALRVIGEMPKWAPGKQKGKEVRVKFTLPVTFRLS